LVRGFTVKMTGRSPWELPRKLVGVVPVKLRKLRAKVKLRTKLPALANERRCFGYRVITSTLPFDEWTETLESERLTGALLDRIARHVNAL
jgi:hypothetical protein